MRSDIIPLRLVDCEFVETVTSFVGPSQSFTGDALHTHSSEPLSDVFSRAAGGLIFKYNRLNNNFRTVSALINAQLDNRLSFPWLLPEMAPRKTLAIVEGSRTHPDYGGTGPSVYSPAVALGIDVVVLDNAGHWMEGPDFAHWRKAFIPTKLVDPPDPDFEHRILQSVEKYQNEHNDKIDGIVTFCDSYMVHVANAAQKLGLPTSEPKSYEIATDKFKTSEFEGHDALLAIGAEGVRKIAAHQALSYPLIIKPCNGWSSEGVLLVNAASELEEAAKSIDTSRHGSDLVVERYCDGPEVDANFVIMDGEILFSEICDDFPKGADSNGQASLATFIELSSVFPSALPFNELEVLKQNFHNSLLRLGLHNGIMHLEGRIQGSQTEYRTQDGVFDLYPAQPSTTPPSSWLIEINPRPPGMKGTQVIESTYGVDYWGLSLLIALRDRTRARALAQPYKRGAQYWCVMVFIPTDFDVESCEGIFDSDDMCVEMMARRPDLAAHISRCGCLVKKGQKLTHPSSGINSFLAYYNVFSRSSRCEALALAEEVRRETRFVVK